MSTLKLLSIVLLVNLSCVLFAQKGLWLYYPMNGELIDQSGNFFNPINNGAQSCEDRFGNPNSAYFFDGTDDYLDLTETTPIINAQEFTICAWAKMKMQGGGFDNQNIIYTQRDDDPASMGESCILLMAEDHEGYIRFLLRGSEYSGSGWDMIRYPAPEYGTWHHYAAVLDDSDTMRLYLDGEEIAKGLYTQEGNFVTSINHMYVGCNKHSGYETRGLFRGSIDEFRLYHYALSAEEIASLDTMIVNIPKQRQENFEFLLYPNPSSDLVTVKVANSKSPYSIYCFDTKGKLLRKYSDIKTNTFNINTHAFSPGTYFVKMSNNFSTSSQKFIVK